MTTLLNNHVITLTAPSVYGSGTVFQWFEFILLSSVLFFTTTILWKTIRKGIKQNSFVFAIYLLSTLYLFVRVLVQIVPIPYDLVWYFLLCIHVPESLLYCAWIILLWWIRASLTPHRSTKNWLLVFHIIALSILIFYQCIAFIVSIVTCGDSHPERREPISTTVMKTIHAVIVLCFILVNFVPLVRNYRSIRSKDTRTVLRAAFIPTSVYISLLALHILFEILESTASYYMVNSISNVLRTCETAVQLHTGKGACVGFSILHVLYDTRISLIPMALLLVSFHLCQWTLNKQLQNEALLNNKQEVDAFSNVGSGVQGSVTSDYKRILAASSLGQSLLTPEAPSSSGRDMGQGTVASGGFNGDTEEPDPRGEPIEGITEGDPDQTDSQLDVAESLTNSSMDEGVEALEALADFD
ncbi:hypothetical protein BLNAU_12885 [Blattamonas nauphoetae]|uniref:Uncharacterized protein n=1 Tax=Blattamonas nauphoetae TaxID=2049346 RepID=A0ABQ9XNL2_9EUKA|nr:hypothetical protein BLNAU_12885 [Blattamonas nauphoetae]